MANADSPGLAAELRAEKRQGPPHQEAWSEGRITPLRHLGRLSVIAQAFISPLRRLKPTTFAFASRTIGHF
jgi:hypothetical protein